MPLVYNLLLFLLSPIIAVYFVWRIYGSGKSRHAWRQQIGRLPENVHRKSNDRLRIWIHTVSVGEAVASAPILREIKSLVPDAEILVSTTTTTGQEMARKSLADAEHFIYFPLDFPMFVLSSLKAVRPDVFVSVESEIWPNFLAAAKSLGIPSLIVNGIVSDNTVKNGRKISRVYRWALSNVDRMLMQTRADAERITNLGAVESRVEVIGNCKFDQESDPLKEPEIVELRKQFGVADGRKVFVAGSINPGEDEPVLDAYKLARQAVQDLKLVLAPRQIERAGVIAEMARARGLSCGRRSLPESITGDEDVVILDTFGELAAVYALCDVSFVGGSLIPKGGHNILQPIAQGKPVFYGPHMFKSRGLVRPAEAAGVGFEIKDAEDLAGGLSDLLSNKTKLEEIRQDALQMMAANRGAAKRYAESIIECGVRNAECGMGKGPSPQRLSPQRLALAPFSLLYAVGLWVYLLPYRLGIRQRYRLPCRVVSVGNLTFGGTGKSPAVRAICEGLVKRGLRPAILSRGHGGSLCTVGAVVSDGNTRYMEAVDCGDEPALLADALPGVPVAIGKDRRKMGLVLIERFSPDVIVLDDGMQYWQLHRDVEITLIRADKPYGMGIVLPAGDLREPVCGISRADVVMITGKELVDPDRLEKLKDEIIRRAPNAKIHTAGKKPVALIDCRTGKRMPVSKLQGMPVVAVSGIASPESFDAMLKECGAKIIKRVSFSDHCSYSKGQIQAVQKAFEDSGAQAIITTAKDAVKLRLSNMYVLDIELVINDMDQLLDEVREDLGFRM